MAFVTGSASRGVPRRSRSTGARSVNQPEPAHSPASASGLASAGTAPASTAPAVTAPAGGTSAGVTGAQSDTAAPPASRRITAADAWTERPMLLPVSSARGRATWPDVMREPLGPVGMKPMRSDAQRSPRADVGDPTRVDGAPRSVAQGHRGWCGQAVRTRRRTWRLSARRSSSLSPPQTPESCPVSIAQFRQSLVTAHRAQTAFASSTWRSAGPVVPIGKKSSGSSSRQSALWRQSMRPTPSLVSGHTAHETLCEPLRLCRG